MGEDRRVRRTRAALIDAFNRLVLERRQRRIAVADVVAEAKVGRSTFYDHYSSADELHLAALRRPFGLLADAAAGRGDEAALERLFAHFWEHRQHARDSFAGRSGERRLRLLADMIEERIAAPAQIPARLAARQMAAAALAPVLAWVQGEVSCDSARLARSICAGGRAIAEALGISPAEREA